MVISDAGTDATKHYLPKYGFVSQEVPDIMPPRPLTFPVCWSVQENRLL
ncbi:MAG: hypothetical protein H2057_06240 [Alphaproteobacteria bacterium]|nr:hypothetical protein [Alphaproteobacteria bacterium]